MHILSMTDRAKKRSLMLDGRATSVSLEDEFWSAVTEIAAEEGIPRAALIARIQQEARGVNLSSAIRLHVLRQYFSATRGSSAHAQGGKPRARLMLPAEAELIIDYFHRATPDFLAVLGVDRARLPARDAWRAHYASQFAKSVAERESLLVLWQLADTPVGFSTADKIERGARAYIHLHLTDAGYRRQGLGTAFVRATARIYFDTLGVQELYCEPYAFNVAPNLALQKEGFRYVMTHETVPGPLNFRQTVNRWLLRRKSESLSLTTVAYSN